MLEADIKQIRQRVDQLLLEQGEYLPLEFLLYEGRLNYSDYEAWRNGELATLDSALFGNVEQIQQQLLQAAAYLQQRGWQAQTITYVAWQHHPAPADSKTLRFSDNNTLDGYFHQRYHQPPDQPQMDLFTDAPATSLVNGIIQALIDRNSSEARRLLEGLYETAPDNVRLGELDCLVDAAESLDSPVNNLSDELRILQEQLVPLAQDLLGKDSRNLLIPLWRRMSSALQSQPYQIARAELHLSYTAGQAQDWALVRRAVERERAWQADPILLMRHARACELAHDQAAALQSWFRLCWQYPQQCDALESGGNPQLHHHWITFLELDPELPTPSFPAWLLIRKPGLTSTLPDPAHDPASPGSYRVAYRLQCRQLSGNSSDNGNIALRAQLKQQDPALFQHFLDKIAHTPP